LNGLAILAVLLAQASPPPPTQPGASFATTLALYAGTPGGLRRTTDWGGSWHTMTGGVGDSLKEIGSVRALQAIGPTVYVGGEGGSYFSTDFGDTWKRLPIEVPALTILQARYFDAEPVILVGTSQGLARSTDGGTTFHSTGIRGTRVSRLEWPGPDMFAATGKGVLRSTDGGTTFSEPKSGLPEGEATALAVSTFFTMDPVVYAGIAGEGLFRSADAGRTWRPAGLAGRTVTDIAWLGPILWAVTDDGLRRSDDGARSWQPVGASLRGRTLGRLVFPQGDQSSAEFFVTTDNGVYRTADGGETWSTAGLQGEQVLTLATFPPNVRSKRRK
jgi:photosystem II stability/assembly factor-like uncharacterized protein